MAGSRIPVLVNVDLTERYIRMLVRKLLIDWLDLLTGCKMLIS